MIFAHPNVYCLAKINSCRDTREDAICSLVSRSRSSRYMLSMYNESHEVVVCLLHLLLWQGVHGGEDLKVQKVLNDGAALGRGKAMKVKIADPR
jgi:hypothetical protein